MSYDISTIQPKWGTPTWRAWYVRKWGIQPMAGGSPDEGGGGDDAGAEGEGGAGELYDMSTVPDELREHLEPIVKDIQGNVTRNFQEHAEQRKAWEPYQNLNLNDYEPEDLSNLLEFAEMANDPDQFRAWWESVGDDNGWTDELNPIDDDDSDDDDLDDSDDDDGIDTQQLVETFKQMIDERVEPLQQDVQTRYEQELLSEASELLNERVEALKEEHGEFDEEIVYTLALNHEGEPDALEKGLQDYQNLVNKIQADTLGGKVNSPSPPEGEGTPNTNGSLPISFDEAAAAARDRMAAAQS